MKSEQNVEHWDTFEVQKFRLIFEESISNIYYYSISNNDYYY